LSIKKSVSYEKIIFLEYLRRYFPFFWFTHNVPIIRVSTQLESSPQLPYSQKKSSFSSSSSQQQQQLNSQPTQYLKNKIDKNNSKKKQKKRQFWEKKQKSKNKNKKKNMWGKLKLNSQLAQY